MTMANTLAHITNVRGWVPPQTGVPVTSLTGVPVEPQNHETGMPAAPSTGLGQAMTRQYAVHEPLCDVVIQLLIRMTLPVTYEKEDTLAADCLLLRSHLYEWMTYGLNVSDCVLYVLVSLVHKLHIKPRHVHDVLLATFRFFQLFNNNYRSMYHLEHFCLTLVHIMSN
jgi:hypothetical protein